MRNSLLVILWVVLWLGAWPRLAAAQAPVPKWLAPQAVAPTAAGSSATVIATALDASGNVYVAGTFTGTVALGGVTLTSAGQEDIFVAKWASRGSTLVWAQQAGGPGSDQATALAQSGGSVYVAGYFDGAAAFGSRTLISAGQSDGFVAKILDAGASGSFAWAQPVGGPGNDQINGLAATASGVYTIGNFTDTATFGPTTLTSLGISDVFISKLTDAGARGSFAWTQPVGSTGNDFGSALAVSGPSVYATGLFGGTTNFGGVAITPSGTFNMFVAKLSDAGAGSSFSWVQAVPGNGLHVVNDLAVSGAYVYLAGRFQGSLSFGPSMLTNVSSFGGPYDIFVAKLVDAGSTGSFTWAQQAGGQLSDYPTAIAVHLGSLYVAGGFAGTAAFGSTTLTSNGSFNDAFVTKILDLNTSGSFQWAKAVGGTGTDQANALAVTPAAIVYVGGVALPPVSFDSYPLASPVAAPTGFLASFQDAFEIATASPQLGLPFSLAPNPAQGTTTVAVPAVAEASTASLTLLDALGRVVRTRTAALPAAGLRTAFDLAGVAPGVYALRVQAGAQVGTARLVVD
ncbi:T9SS type A sorting domain-containing protein [Hymenobacter sp. BRD128]|uniref:T9SS type A sorting domain-containing protein n=1 Tax=Hymenobacter sp. BRD128 TaxID=2675878 RepID=UPI00156772D7|nr:T9SS type A sorting domain-containing protein [Hymenobacter sp. BRD128]QKG58705.1 T9SS type A sorting domain-containing protein [Hymenobacter sp. BRD128]